VFFQREGAALSPICNLNKHLLTVDEDYLYHLSLAKRGDNLKLMFGDVKFICLGGSPKRMHQFALYMKEVLRYELPVGLCLNNISEASDRYAMYKIGPVISVSHGMGCSSISILLNELIKLVHYAGCKNVTFLRIGTCGGIGVEPGSIVITNEAVDGMFRPEYREVMMNSVFLLL
jgi:uridine phosphorylase